MVQQALSRTMAFKMVTRFRARAMRATFLGFPAARHARQGGDLFVAEGAELRRISGP
jgi:hypothetical protein